MKLIEKFFLDDFLDTERVRKVFQSARKEHYFFTPVIFPDGIADNMALTYEAPDCLYYLRFGNSLRKKKGICWRPASNVFTPYKLVAFLADHRLAHPVPLTEPEIYRSYLLHLPKTYPQPPYTELLGSYPIYLNQRLCFTLEQMIFERNAKHFAVLLDGAPAMDAAVLVLKLRKLYPAVRLEILCDPTFDRDDYCMQYLLHAAARAVSADAFRVSDASETIGISPARYYAVKKADCILTAPDGLAEIEKAASVLRRAVVPLDFYQ